MVKKRLTYKVQRGDDYTKIADRLYGDKRYHTALMKQNPHVKKVSPGVVINLLDDDPKEMWKKRERGRRRQSSLRKKNWDNFKRALGINPDLSEIEPTPITIQPPVPPEPTTWWEDPAFQEGLIGLVESTAESMGLDANVMLEELGLGEGSPLLAEAPPTGQAQPRTGSPSSTNPPKTDEQKKALKKELGEMGLDADVAMEELGLGQGNTPQKSSGSTGIGKGLTSDLRSDQVLENLYDLAALREASSAGQVKGKAAESSTIGPTLTDELEKTLNDIAQEMGLDVDTMIGELGLVKRDDAELQEYLDTVGIPVDKYYELPWMKKLSIESEHLNLYNGYFMENGMFTPTLHILDHSGFGDGFESWDPYYIPGAERNVAQNMSPVRLVSEEVQKIAGNLRDSYDTNLCGQLAVIAALGLDIEEGMNIFAELEIRPWDNNHNYGGDASNGYDILQNNLTTSFLTLEDFLIKAGGENINAEFHRAGKDPIDTPEKFAENLASGNIVIACVNIDTTQNGQLMSTEKSSEDTPHWVWVQDVITTKDDETLVRVYNPYMNREEIYDWDTFSGAYKNTPGNTSVNLAVVASFTEP